MSDLLRAVLALGTVPSAQADVALQPAEWFAAAEGRPSWQLWGKGRPRGACPAHPLLCHMLDVAAVAAVLLTQVIAPSIRDRLLASHPDGPDAALRWLLFVIALHDLGKASPEFQKKLPSLLPLLLASGFDVAPPSVARHHGDLGFPLVTVALREIAGDPTAMKVLARAVAAHHGEFPAEANLTARGRPPPSELGTSLRWGTARGEIVADLRALFRIERGATSTLPHADAMILSGLTAVADWIGSMDEVFTYVPPQPNLAGYWTLALERAQRALDVVGMRALVVAPRRGFAQLFPHLPSPWPLHQAADNLARDLSEPTLFVIEAPMGEGKTEAALLLAEAANASLSQRGIYFGLPTRATANQMLGRVREFLERVYPDRPSSLVLAHGESDLVERFRELVAIYDKPSASMRDGSSVRAEGWFLSKKRSLLAEYGVGTVDQPLLGVMRTMHSFVRLYALAGKVVVLDEVHAYDAYTSTLLDRLLAWLAALGATVVILSATLPSPRRQALLAAWRRGLCAGSGGDEPSAAYPRVSIATRAGISAVHVDPRGDPRAVILDAIDDDIDEVARQVVAAAQHGCIGWICNTVDRAQAAYRAIRALAPAVPRLLLHARLLPEDRAERERTLERWLGPERRGAERPARCIVVGTQVLEQSLDVDFDLLFTDLAPIDLLLQRIGRVFRHDDRTNRAPLFHEARAVIVRPDGPWETTPLKRVAAVYHEALTRETLRVLAGRRAVTLPNDIEPLVEAVYATGIPPADDPIHEAWKRYMGERAGQRQNAAGRLLGAPHEEDDIFECVSADLFDEENTAVHPMLRAMTRDADDALQVLCLVEREGRLFLDEHDTTALDPDTLPPREVLRGLTRRSIGVSKPSAVRSLGDGASDVPTAWRESALLKFRKIARFRDGVARIDGHVLRLDPDLGLVIERTLPSQGTSSRP